MRAAAAPVSQLSNGAVLITLIIVSFVKDLPHFSSVHFALIVVPLEPVSLEEEQNQFIDPPPPTGGTERARKDVRA